LCVASTDLRRLLRACPQLTDAAVEMESGVWIYAKRNIFEALKSDDPRRRDAASMFTIRNSHHARRRRWITTSTGAGELAVSTGANAPREVALTTTSVTPSAEEDRLRDDGELVRWSCRRRPIQCIIECALRWRPSPEIAEFEGPLPRPSPRARETRGETSRVGGQLR
jgi:hypothetical protein